MRKVIIIAENESIGEPMVIKRISTHLTNKELNRSCEIRTKNTHIKTTWAVLPTKFQQ